MRTRTELVVGQSGRGCSGIKTVADGVVRIGMDGPTTLEQESSSRDGWLPSASTVHDPAASFHGIQTAVDAPIATFFLSFSPVGNTVGGLCVLEIGGRAGSFKPAQAAEFVSNKAVSRPLLLANAPCCSPVHVCGCVGVCDRPCMMYNPARVYLLVRDLRDTCQGHIYSEKGFQAGTRGFKVRTRGLQSPWIVLTYIGKRLARS